MLYKTTNCVLKMQINGVCHSAYCTTMGKGMKIKLVIIKSTHEKMLKKAIAAYNKLHLSITINNEQLWFDVVKFDRNIPIEELSL